MDRFESFDFLCAYESFMSLSADERAMEGVGAAASSALQALKNVVKKIVTTIVTAIKKFINFLRRKASKGEKGRVTVKSEQYKSWTDMVVEVGYIIDTFRGNKFRTADHSSKDDNDVIKRVVKSFNRIKQAHDTIMAGGGDDTITIDPSVVERETNSTVKKVQGLSEELDEIGSIQSGDSEEEARDNKIYIGKMRRVVTYAVNASALLTKATDQMLRNAVK